MFDFDGLDVLETVKASPEIPHESAEKGLQAGQTPQQTAAAADDTARGRQQAEAVAVEESCKNAESDAADELHILLPKDDVAVANVLEEQRRCRMDGGELFTGECQTLGGDGPSAAMSPAERKAAALAAAERRARKSTHRGVSEKKGRELQDKHVRECLISKINELHAKRHEEPPKELALASAGVDALREYLRVLTAGTDRQEAQALLRPSSSAAASSSSAMSRTALAEKLPVHPHLATMSSSSAAPASSSQPQPTITATAHPEQLPLPPAEALTPERLEHRRELLLERAQLRREEIEEVSLLEMMGFDIGRAIEAYVACDRNQELAANFLLEHGGEEFDEPAAASGAPHLAGLPLIPVVPGLSSGHYHRGGATEAVMGAPAQGGLSAAMPPPGVGVWPPTLGVAPAAEGGAGGAAFPADPGVIRSLMMGEMPAGYNHCAEGRDRSLAAWEMEAVRRITELGFQSQTALEAFFRHNKDEELASNWLLG